MSMLHYVLTMVFMVSCGRNTMDHIFTEHLFTRLGTFAFPILEYLLYRIEITHCAWNKVHSY